MQARTGVWGAICATLFCVNLAEAETLSTVARELKASGAAAQVAACPIHARAKLQVGFDAPHDPCAGLVEPVKSQVVTAAGSEADGPWTGTPFGKAGAPFGQTDVFGRNTAFAQTTAFGQNAFFGVKP